MTTTEQHEQDPDAARKAMFRARADKLRDTVRGKLDAEFIGRTFDIVREVHLPIGQVFRTKFGHYGRHGFVIRDRATGEEMVVGRRLLRIIHDRYLGVSLPRRRRPEPDTD